MKTDDFIAMLANRVEPARPGRMVAHQTGAILLGAAISIGITMAALGPNPHLREELGLPAFWLREAFCLASGTLGLLALTRLARPGRRLGRAGGAMLLPTLVMALLAAMTLAGAPAPQRLALVLGGSAAVCPFRILVIGSPFLVALGWVLRGLAPTRLRASGAVAGFASGGLGALVYTLHCPELAPSFLAVWYVLGILLLTGLGAVLGPRMLRW